MNCACSLGFKLIQCLLIIASVTLPPSSGADHQPDQKYSAAAKKISALIEDQLRDKKIPAISIALIDDQQIVWSAGFGLARSNVLATADTIYRVGSISKLFTDLAAMQLVEQGKLDLDKPITTYLPSFKPRNPFNGEITLRQLMGHRAGLCREPPIGNYFDPEEPTLAQTIASLNETELVYPPGERTKYSNAGIAVVGAVLEEILQKEFTRLLQEQLLAPLGMTNSAFALTPALQPQLADGLMWTLHGKTFPAPQFELGIAPAGSLYTSVNDLAKFMIMLFAEGSAGNKKLIQPATLAQMLKVQFADESQKTGFGLGFSLSEIDGHRTAGHNGAMYGFASQFTALRDQKIGVIVVASKDFVNTVSDRIGDYALRSMLAVKENKPLPEIVATQPIPSDVAKKLEGRYIGSKNSFDLRESNGEVTFLWTHGGFPKHLRQLGSAYTWDGPTSFGQTITPTENGLKLGHDHYRSEPFTKPKPAPARWTGLIGEYGWDHDVLYIFEQDGQLWALIEWFEFNPLTEISENEFAFPERGLYAGEKLLFTRDEFGGATEVVAANVRFHRRQVGPAPGQSQLRVSPVRPVAELREEALKSEPPRETGDFLPPDLVEIAKLDPTIKLDIRYARDENFLGTPFYTEPRAFLQKPVAQAVLRAHQKLQPHGYGVMIFDGYRPWSVTKVFWDATPDEHKFLVADPSKGSRHNRGAAVDLTLYHLATGQPVEMVGTYDEVTARSYPDYPGGTSLQRWHRALLRDVMESEGFTVYPEEWWHFDYKDWRRYSILNFQFEELEN